MQHQVHTPNLCPTFQHTAMKNSHLACLQGKPCAQLRMARLEERELPSPLVFPEGNGLQVLEVLSCTMKVSGAILSEFEHLDNLRHLSLSKCGGLTPIGTLPENPVLTSLPENIGTMTDLLRLDLSGCASLAEIPDAGFTGLGKLQHLNLSGCSKLTKLPDTLGDLTSLVTLDLSGCEELQELPERMEELMLLETLDLSFCSALTALPGCIIGTLDELKTQGTLPLMCVMSSQQLVPNLVTNMTLCRPFYAPAAITTAITTPYCCTSCCCFPLISATFGNDCNFCPW